MNNDMMIYQEKLKENINQLINQNRLEDAKVILKQYEEIVKNDMDVYSIKGVIAMMEGDMDRAESVLNEGVSIDGQNFDLLYNLAYLYHSNSQNELAIEYYKKAIENTKSKTDADEIYEILQTLGVEEDKKELIDSDKRNLSIDSKTKMKRNEIDSNTNTLDELESYKKRFKENIQLLIEQGLLQEAINMVSEYEKIIENDIDTYSIKGVIAMIEGDIYKAESILLEGLNINNGNFDLFYNLAYLYKSNNQDELAIIYYKRALQNSKKKTEEDEAYKILQGLGVNESKKEILENSTVDIYYTAGNKFEKEGNKSDAALNYGLAYRYSNNKNFKNKLSQLYSDNKPLRNIFDVASKGIQKRFIVLSSCGWADVYQRMHHISRSLAKFGHEVIYVTPTATANINNKSISISELNKYSFGNFKIIDNVKIYTPISAIYNEQHVANNYIDLVQNLLDLPTGSSQTVIITYMPYQVQAINCLKGDFMHIYECVDDHSDLEYAFWGNKNDVIWEPELMDRADAITTTATSLFLKCRAIDGRENVYLSRNAVNESDFILKVGEEVPEDLKNIPEPRIVYIGAIYEWFNTELFYDVIKSNPDKSFVIIGFGKDEILKEKCPNLYILGAKKHSELKSYLKHMNIGIIPFKSDKDIIINCDPIKQYEYTACKLPVITTFMPDTAINKINTFLANTKESFNEAIEKSLKLKVDNNVVSNFLAENSWNARAALLCRLSDKDITEEEQEKTVRHIIKELDSAIEKYDSPIFKALKAMCLNLKDSNIFEKLAKEAYDIDKQKHIEKQYLTALLKNNNMSAFIDVVSNSSNIKEELKQELLHCKKIDNVKCIEIMSYISIGNIRYALNLINKLANEKIKLLYQMYIKHTLGAEISSKEINQVMSNIEKSPLLKFLQEKYKSSNNAKIVSIIGYFGEDNIGDEALLASVLDRLKLIPSVQPVVIAFANPERVENMHNVMAIDGNDAEQIIRIISMSDLVILGPGGLIEDYARLDPKFFFSPRGMYRYLFPIILSQLYGKTTIGYGLGIGPLEMKESKNAVKLAFSGMDKIFVRDAKSLSLLEEMGLNNIELSADAVLNLKSANDDLVSGLKCKEGNLLIGISIRPFIGVDMKMLVKELSNLIVSLLKNTDFEFILIPMQYEYDMPVIKELNNFITALSDTNNSRLRIIEEKIGYKELMELIDSIDIMIGMRLHSIIMASKANIPFIAMSYDSKVSEFAKGVKMGEYVIDVNEVTADSLQKKIIHLLSNSNRENLTEYSNEVKRQKKLEDKSWGFVREHLQESTMPTI